MLEASGFTLRNLVRKWLLVAFTQLHPELITSTMPQALQGLGVEWGEKGGLLKRDGQGPGGFPINTAEQAGRPSYLRKHPSEKCVNQH